MRALFLVIALASSAYGMALYNTTPLRSSGPIRTNMVFWIDANDASTVTLSSGKITNWNDKSVSALAGVQGTGANQPTTATLNGKTCGSFNGSTNYIDFGSTSIITAGTTFTMHWVVQLTDFSNGSYPQWLGLKNSSSEHMVFGFSNDLLSNLFWGSSSDTAWSRFKSTAFPSPAGTAFVITLKYDGASTYTLYNGTSTVAVTTASGTSYTSKTGNFTVGQPAAGATGVAMYGLVCEGMVYTDQKSATDVTYNVNYLKNKWAL